MINARWHYSGDVNPEYGGIWYRLDSVKYGYADCVRITPCSDAGLPDNQFWVESMSVRLPDTDKGIEEVMSTYGWLPDDLPKGAKRWHMLLDACVSCGRYDIDRTVSVQIGTRVCEYYSGREEPLKPDVTLRANARIENYVRREFLRGA